VRAQSSTGSKRSATVAAWYLALERVVTDLISGKMEWVSKNQDSLLPMDQGQMSLEASVVKLLSTDLTRGLEKDVS
jgi:hypothetical protein